MEPELTPFTDALENAGLLHFCESDGCSGQRAAEILEREAAAFAVRLLEKLELSKAYIARIPRAGSYLPLECLYEERDRWRKVLEAK